MLFRNQQQKYDNPAKSRWKTSIQKCDILLKLALKKASEENNLFDKSKKKYFIRKVDFLNSWKGVIFYFIFLISTLYVLNRYFISNIDIIEFQIIEEKKTK